VKAIYCQSIKNNRLILDLLDTLPGTSCYHWCTVKGEKVKYKLALLLLFSASIVRADSIPSRYNTDRDENLPSMHTVKSYIASNSVLPLRGSTAERLAENLLDAQVLADLDQPDSLALSEQSVLRAIWIEAQYGGMTECDRSDCSLVWAQSEIAINDLAHVTLTPPVLNFGPTPAVPISEPSSLLLTGIGLLGVAAAFRRCRLW
jgi:hypothetical protein